MTASARTWSEHDLDHRFNQGPPHDELTELADTLDQLLERTADALRREQRLSAEISHELRTPLARIATEAELGLRRDRTMEEYRHALEAIEQNVRAMTRIIDALLGAARAAVAERRGFCSVRQVINRVVETTAEVATARGVTVTSEIATPELKVSADLELACRILQPVLDNACRYGRSTVTVAAERDRHDVRFTIRDDGAGVPAAERERIFQPGIRGGSAVAEPAGAGLGLPLARRLAESIGGTITAAPGPGGTFVIRLPAVR
jgi:signal transduction histidine kinase